MDALWHEDRCIVKWEDLHDELFSLERQAALACRGDAGAHDDLRPSLDRCFETHGVKGDERYAIEQVLLKRFAKFAGMHLPDSLQGNLSDAMQVMILMRHYGAPTRLLDWTESIWVAAYVASHRRPESPGLIWVFDRNALYDATAADEINSEISNFMSEPSDEDGFWRWLLFSPARLTASCRQDPRQWVAMLHQLRSTFPRLVAQQGFFTVASRLGLDHANVIPAMLKGRDQKVPCRKIRFHKSLKPTLLQSLEKKGVTGASLFPGLEGICHHLSDLVQYARDDDGVKRWIKTEQTGVLADTVIALSPDNLENIAGALEAAAKGLRQAASTIRGSATGDVKGTI